MMFMSNSDPENLDRSQKLNHLFIMPQCYLMQLVNSYPIAPDKAAYCVVMHLLEPGNAIKFISVPTKTK